VTVKRVEAAGVPRKYEDYQVKVDEAAAPAGVTVIERL